MDSDIKGQLVGHHGNPFKGLHLDKSSVFLTDDHAQSSYGQPVIVRESDGEALGPDDIDGEVALWGPTEDTPKLVEKAKENGYTINYRGKYEVETQNLNPGPGT